MTQLNDHANTKNNRYYTAGKTSKYKCNSYMKKVKYVVLSAVQQEQESSVPSSSYDLWSCDEYLWGSFKDKAYKNIHTQGTNLNRNL